MAAPPTVRAAGYFMATRAGTGVGEATVRMTTATTGTLSMGGLEWKITGDLTIHGVTREVVLNAKGPTPEAKDPFGNTRIGASASTKIKRSDFGLTWNAALETGGILVGDDLKIELDVSAIRSEVAAAA